MKSLIYLISFVFFGLISAQSSYATTDATCIIYQPINMRSESSVIQLPNDGFIIFAIPYSDRFSSFEKPYNAITRPYTMLSMAEDQEAWDSNLISCSGIKIQSHCIFAENEIKEEVVTVDVSQFKAKDHDLSIEVIVEATLECIRLTATNKRQNWKRPTLKIIGKSADEVEWKRWVNLFNKQDFSKPFTRPLVIEKNAEQNVAPSPNKSF